MTSSGVTATGVDWVRGTEQPLDGHTSVEVQSWQAMTFDRTGVFRQSLRDLGLSATDIRDALEFRDEAARQASKAVSDFWENHPYRYRATPPDVQRQVDDIYESARSSGLGRLRDWLSGRSIQVDEVEQLQIKLPLFTLSAASKPGCAARFATEETRERRLDWSVTIFGTGGGNGGSITTSASAKFIANTGETKVIFVPVTIKVERVTLLEHGKPVSQGHRVDLSELKSKETYPGLLLLAPDAVPKVGKLVDNVFLSGDPSGAIATYEHKYRRAASGNLQLGVKAFGADLNVKTEVKMDTAVMLSYDLRGGYDYELYRLAQGDGLLWR